jgi:pimeloyl-ACP methyl ester carboxylesterase
MSISEALGERRTVEVPAGTIEYRERGSGPPIVFVHGIVVNGDLWRGVAPELAAGHRCIVPDLPLGSHSHALRDGTDMSLPGLAAIVDDFLKALGLEDVTIVANDTGGALATWMAARRPERIGRLVLTSCDAFDNFLPPVLRYLQLVGRLRPLVWSAAWSMRFKFVQRMPIAFGWTTRRPIEKTIMESYVGPIRRDAGVRHDFQRLALAVDSRYTIEAAEALPSFDKPAVVIWAAEDKLFPLEHGRRLAELLPQGRLETIQDSRTFIPEDQPRRLAELVREFLGDRRQAGAVS